MTHRARASVKRRLVRGLLGDLIWCMMRGVMGPALVRGPPIAPGLTSGAG